MSVTSELNDHKFADYLATKVGKELLQTRSELHSQGIVGKTLKDAGDKVAHDLIMLELNEHRPDDAVLSEEGKDDLERLSAERVWIVDPLDGTREFSEVPRTDWAVHIALVENNRPVAGAVALPAQGITLSTDAPPVLPDQATALKVIVSRTRRPAPAIALAGKLGAEYVEMGSAGAKAMAVVQGEADIYAHAGGQFEWDSCAPVAVAQAAGLHCSRIDGSEMLYNAEDPYLPDLLICRKDLAEKCLEILAGLEE